MLLTRDQSAAACQILLANLRTVLDEVEQLLDDPAQTMHEAVADKLIGAQAKAEVAAGLAAHGAGKVAASVEGEDDADRLEDGQGRRQEFARTAARNQAMLESHALKDAGRVAREKRKARRV
jgi:hypothetical protein